MSLNYGIRRHLRITIGGAVLAILWGLCFASLPWTLHTSSNFYYDQQRTDSALLAPRPDHTWLWFGTSKLGQSLLGQCLAGGVISLTIGIAAAAISVVLGVTVGLISGYQGGWIDSLLMRTVDILYALPYILLVILFKIALESPLGALLHSTAAANLVVLFLSIGLVSFVVAHPAVHRVRPRRRRSATPDFPAPSAAEFNRPDHGLRNAHCPPGDPPGIAAQLSGHRNPKTIAHVGLAGQRRTWAGTRAGRFLLVAAAVSVYAARRDIAGAEFRRRRVKRRV